MADHIIIITNKQNTTTKFKKFANQYPTSPDCEGNCLAVEEADACLLLIVTIRLTLQTRNLDTPVFFLSNFLVSILIVFNVSKPTTTFETPCIQFFLERMGVCDVYQGTVNIVCNAIFQR